MYNTLVVKQLIGTKLKCLLGADGESDGKRKSGGDNYSKVSKIGYLLTWMMIVYCTMMIMSYKLLLTYFNPQHLVLVLLYFLMYYLDAQIYLTGLYVYIF